MTDPKPTPEKVKRGRMLSISELIAELEETRRRFGNTCVYIRDVSWGAVALNRKADDDALKTEDADEARAARFVTSGYVRECLTLEFAAVRGEGVKLEREGCIAELKGLAEDARDDGDGSDDELSVALEDAADALRARGAS